MGDQTFLPGLGQVMRQQPDAVGAQTLGLLCMGNGRAGGAAGSIGSEAAARSAPDGYTLLGGTVSSHAINISLYPKLGYDPIKSFSPITLIGTNPVVLVEIRKILAQPDMQTRLKGFGMEPADMSVAQIATFQKAEVDKWAQVIKAANIKVD